MMSAANDSIRAFLSALGHVEAGGVTEVCVFQDGDAPSHIGYFDDLDAAAKAIEARDGRGNIFVTLNPATRALLARGNNRLVEGSFKKKLKRTKDTEIHRDSWFLLDVDPNRPSGISSTDEEKREALEVAKSARDWLLSVGVPASAMITADSGNGAYVLVRTLDSEINDQHVARKKAFLNFIADRFDAKRVKIDRSVYNPARLIGALGAIKVKGENIPERPHRRSSVRTIAGEAFDPTREQRCEPFELYELAARLLPPIEEKSVKKMTVGKKSQGNHAIRAGDGHFDARRIADQLEYPKPTGRDFTYYRCPNCGNSGKFWIDQRNGKSGCFEPPSVCDWRKLRDKLREMAGDQAAAAPENGARDPNPQADDGDQGALAIREFCLTDIREEAVDWLWEPRIPRGMLTLLEGIEGEGKSTVLCAIAAAVTCGKGIEGMIFDRGPGMVLWLSAEDSPGHVLKPRLLAAGADPSRVFVVGEAFTFDDAGAQLVAEMVERRKPDLVVIDPIFAFTDGDPNKGEVARRVTNRLKEIAEKFNCAIVLVRHVGKSKGLGDPRAAGLYSIEWRAAARSVLLCGSDPDNPHDKALTQHKNNLRPLADSIGYRIVEHPPGSKVSRAEWTGASRLTARRILAQAGDEDEKAERINAEDFLKDLLKDVEVKASEVMADAQKNGISERTLHRAKARLGIKSRSEGFRPKVWYWRLPDFDDPASGQSVATEDCQNADSGNLRENFFANGNADSDLVEGCHIDENGNLRETPNPSVPASKPADNAVTPGRGRTIRI